MAGGHAWQGGVCGRVFPVYVTKFNPVFPVLVRYLFIYLFIALEDPCSYHRSTYGGRLGVGGGAAWQVRLFIYLFI